MRKRIFSIGISAVMIGSLSLTACGGKSSGDRHLRQAKQVKPVRPLWERVLPRRLEIRLENTIRQLK